MLASKAEVEVEVEDATVQTAAEVAEAAAAAATITTDTTEEAAEVAADSLVEIVTTTLRLLMLQATTHPVAAAAAARVVEEDAATMVGVVVGTRTIALRLLATNPCHHAAMNAFLLLVVVVVAMEAEGVGVATRGEGVRSVTMIVAVLAVTVLATIVLAEEGFLRLALRQHSTGACRCLFVSVCDGCVSLLLVRMVSSYEISSYHVISPHHLTCLVLRSRQDGQPPSTTQRPRRPR